MHRGKEGWGYVQKSWRNIIQISRLGSVNKDGISFVHYLVLLRGHLHPFLEPCISKWSMGRNEAGTLAQPTWLNWYRVSPAKVTADDGGATLQLGAELCVI